LVVNRVKGYTLVWYYFLISVGLTKEDKLQGKIQIDTLSLRLLQTTYFLYCVMFVKYFMQFETNICSFGFLKTANWVVEGALLRSN